MILDLLREVLCCQVVQILQETRLDQKVQEGPQALMGQTVPVDQCHQEVQKIQRHLVVQGDQMAQKNQKHQILQMGRAGQSVLYLLEAQMGLLVQQALKDLDHQVALVVLSVQENPDLLLTQMHLASLVAPGAQKAQLVQMVLHHQKVLGLQVDHQTQVALQAQNFLAVHSVLAVQMVLMVLWVLQKEDLQIRPFGISQDFVYCLSCLVKLFCISDYKHCPNLS